MIFTVNHYESKQMGPMKSDHNKWLITLITLSSFHCRALTELQKLEIELDTCIKY
jgi:hypothetical protein